MFETSERNFFNAFAITIEGRRTFANGAVTRRAAPSQTRNYERNPPSDFVFLRSFAHPDVAYCPRFRRIKQTHRRNLVSESCLNEDALDNLGHSASAARARRPGPLAAATSDGLSGNRIRPLNSSDGLLEIEPDTH